MSGTAIAWLILGVALIGTGLGGLWWMGSRLERANDREFRRQVASMRADGRELDPEIARLFAKWGYRP